MNELERWLANPLVVLGLILIVGGIFAMVLASTWRYEYERGGYDSVHRGAPGKHRKEADSGYHAIATARVRVPQEAYVKEESRAYRERWQDEGRPFPYGEEGRAHPEASQAITKIFRNDITGEVVFVDEAGRRVEFES